MKPLLFSLVFILAIAEPAAGGDTLVALHSAQLVVNEGEESACLRLYRLAAMRRSLQLNDSTCKPAESESKGAYPDGIAGQLLWLLQENDGQEQEDFARPLHDAPARPDIEKFLLGPDGEKNGRTGRSSDPHEFNRRGALKKSSTPDRDAPRDTMLKLAAHYNPPPVAAKNEEQPMP